MINKFLNKTSIIVLALLILLIFLLKTMTAALDNTTIKTIDNVQETELALNNKKIIYANTEENNHSLQIKQMLNYPEPMNIAVPVNNSTDQINSAEKIDANITKAAEERFLILFFMLLFGFVFLFNRLASIRKMAMSNSANFKELLKKIENLEQENKRNFLDLNNNVLKNNYGELVNGYNTLLEATNNKIDYENIKRKLDNMETNTTLTKCNLEATMEDLNSLDADILHIKDTLALIKQEMNIKDNLKIFKSNRFRKFQFDNSSLIGPSMKL